MRPDNTVAPRASGRFPAWRRDGIPASVARAFVIAGLAILSACGPKTPEGREALHLQQARGYLAAKDLKKAVIEFRVAAQNMPKDAVPMYELGKTYLALGARAQALSAFEKTAELNPKHEGAQYELALAKVTSDRPEIIEEARQTLTNYLTAHPADTEAMGGLALAQAKLGNKADTLRLLDLAATSPSAVRTASIIIAWYAAKGDVQTAIEISRDISTRLPNSPEAAVLRAQVSLATKDTADADAEIDHALSLKRDFRPALQLRLRREIMSDDTKSAEATTQELAKQPEEQMWGAYARVLFAEGRIDAGIAEFERALKEHNDAPKLRDQYSELLISVGRSREAKVVVDGTLAKDKNDKTALLQLVSMAIDSGDLDTANRGIQALQGLKAFSPVLSYQVSRLAGARGDKIKQGDSLAETLKYNPRFFPARVDLTRLLVTSGKPQDGLSILEQASPAEKRSAEYFFYHNLALMSAGDWDAARKGVDAALTAKRLPGFLYEDALMRARNKDLIGARKSLDEALKMSPADPTTLGLLGGVMRQQGQEQQFVALLRDAAAKNPGMITLQSGLGAELAAIGDEKGARAAFDTAKAAGGTANAEIDLALLDVRDGHPEQGRQRLLDLVKTHDTSRAEVMLAELEMKLGSPDAVIQRYLKALQLDPNDLSAMNNLADFLASRPDKMDDAVFWAKKARAMAPTDPIVADTLGWILYRAGKFDTALPYLDDSAKKFDRPVAHYHLAAALMKTGDAARGRREYDAGVKEDAKSPDRSAVAPLFEAGR
jgi:cellulose synthase operon protein C